MRTLVWVASALLVGGTVEAQATVNGRPATAEEERRAATAVAGLRDGVMQRFMMVDSAAMNRATLGLMLGGSPTKRDTLGVFVEGVAEDGPAERAGIYEGHRIAFINNVDVRASAGDAGDPYLSSVGQHRLMRVMRDLTAGNTVTLRVWTGSGYRDVQVTTARYADVFKNQRFGGQWQGSFGPGAMSFGPALERMKIEGPMLREFHLRSPREVRIETRPGEPAVVTPLRAAEIARSVRGAVPTPRAPRVLVAPSVQVTPRAISVPRLAPTPASRRRFVI
jgi:hypothetical protein